MPKRFATSIDLMGLALINACLNPLSSDPSGLGAGDAGRIWWNTTTTPGGTLKVWSGTAAIDLLARANATGTQTASTISDFTSAVQALKWANMTAPTSAVNMSSQQFSSLGTATSAGQAVEYTQFNNAIAAVNAGMDFKAPPAEVVATANVSLSAPGTTINGHTMAAGDTVLLSGQTTTTQNGIYTWNSSTSLTRRADASSNSSIFSGTMISVGATDSTNADTVWMQTAVGTGTNGAITVGTDAQTWIKPFTSTTYTAGNGISIASSVLSAVVAGSANSADTATGSTNGVLVGGSGLYLDPATGLKKVYGTIPTASTGIYTVSGAAVTIAHSLGNMNAKAIVKAGSSPQAVGGVTPSQGEVVEVQDVVTSPGNNTVLTFPAAPTTNAWTFEIFG